MFMRPPSLSPSLLWARMLTGNPGVNRSATFECDAASIPGCAPMSQVSAHDVSALCADFSVKLFACGLTFMFRLAQVFKTSSGCGYRMPAARRTSVALFLVDESGSILEAGDGTWGLDVPVIGDFNTPRWVRVVTSSSVNRSRSAAVPGNRVSVFADGPTVKNGASPPDRGSEYGAA